MGENFSRCARTRVRSDGVGKYIFCDIQWSPEADSVGFLDPSFRGKTVPCSRSVSAVRGRRKNPLSGWHVKSATSFINCGTVQVKGCTKSDCTKTGCTRVVVCTYLHIHRFLCTFFLASFFRYVQLLFTYVQICCCLFFYL